MHVLDPTSSAACAHCRKNEQQELAETTKQNLGIHQTVEIRYVCAVDHHTYRRNERSTRYDDSASHKIPETVKKLCSQRNTQSFDAVNTGSLYGFQTKFKLAQGANCIL